MESKRKKELKEQAKAVKTYIGVYKITNNRNGKTLIDTSRNLKNQWDRLIAQLTLGSSPHRNLQEDFKNLGKDAFAFEILEEKDAAEVADVKFELSLMEKEWLDSEGLFEPDGYNRKK